MRLLTSTLLIALCWSVWPADARADDAQFIRGLYRDYLGRKPTRDEVRTWRDALDRGVSRQEVRVGFLASEEFYDHHERDRSRLVRALFRHVAGRAPHRGEVDMWVRHWHENHGEDRAAMVRDFMRAVRRAR
jgi:hypothetical protein